MRNFDYEIMNAIGQVQEIRHTCAETHITTVYGDGTTSTTTHIG